MNDWLKTVSIRDLFLSVGGVTALLCAFALLYSELNKSKRSNAASDFCGGRPDVKATVDGLLKDAAENAVALKSRLECHTVLIDGTIWTIEPVGSNANINMTNGRGIVTLGVRSEHAQKLRAGQEIQATCQFERIVGSTIVQLGPCAEPRLKTP